MPDAVVPQGVSIHFDTFGDPRDPAVLLVMGLGTQMIGWRTEFCATLAARGLYVVRFDNRDIGLSTKLDGAPATSLPRTLLLRRLGLARSAYTISDMARDSIGVLDHLGIDSAHWVGVSMGGMIAQTIAIEHPSRARSLTSIMSSPGDRRLPTPSGAASAVLLRRPPRSRDEAVQRVIDVFRVIGSPRYFDQARVAARAAESYDRSSYRVGVSRQLDAILCSPPRDVALRSLRIPTTVLHGALDPLVRLEHGLATARAIPDAELRVIDDLAHDLPDERWPIFHAAIERSVERAG
ncbi:MAG: alpha/beta fold hydrolase [Myxococcota bacterium]|nr:alpha/beta fold hydrolase [Myxococcota bacterium]